MTQPTVSRRLMRLEKAIGARLFERDRRGPRLTREGHRINNDANAALVALSRAAGRTNRPAKRVEGDCKLFSSDGIASYWLAPFLAEFFGSCPDIELKVYGSHDPQDKRAALDLNIHYYEPADSNLLGIRLATSHFVPFGSREYLRTQGTPKSAEDLKDHSLFDLEGYLPYAESLGSRFRGKASPQRALLTNLSGCFVEAVRHGAGIAMLPTYFVLVDDAFVPLEIGLHYQAPVFISYRREAVEKLPVRTTLDFLIDRVFDSKTMPWFADGYVPPAPGWVELYSAALKHAAGPPKTGLENLQESLVLQSSRQHSG